MECIKYGMHQIAFRFFITRFWFGLIEDHENRYELLIDIVRNFISSGVFFRYYYYWSYEPLIDILNGIDMGMIEPDFGASFRGAWSGSFGYFPFIGVSFFRSNSASFPRKSWN